MHGHLLSSHKKKNQGWGLTQRSPLNYVGYTISGDTSWEFPCRQSSWRSISILSLQLQGPDCRRCSAWWVIWGWACIQVRALAWDMTLTCSSILYTVWTIRFTAHLELLRRNTTLLMQWRRSRSDRRGFGHYTFCLNINYS